MTILPEQALLKTKDVAARLNCSETFVLDLARAGVVRALKLGSHWRFDATDVDAYLNRSEFKPVVQDAIARPEPLSVPGLPLLDKFKKRRG